MAEENEKAVGTAKQNAPVLGKFESVDALMRAYGELEAEFTRRSQKLRELERRNKEADPADQQTDASASETADSARASDESEALYRRVTQNEEVRTRVLSDYLESLKSVPLMTGAGAGVTAPAKKPGSIKEAGNLALGYLKSKKERR